MTRDSLTRYLARAARDRVTSVLPRRRDLHGREKRVTFFAAYAYATGGIPRAVFAVANELAERGYDVEVVSLYRTHREPSMQVSPKVRVSYLEAFFNPEDPRKPFPRARADSGRNPVARLLDARPTALAQDPLNAFSRHTDLLLRRKMASLPPGIVVTTRPELAAAAVRYTHPDMIIVNQEHLTFQARAKGLRDALAGTKDRLDALLTLTDADLEAWKGVIGPTSMQFGVIPNASPFEVGEPAPLSNRIVIAAGRLTGQKAFDRLIEAFTPIARAHPDWELHIYGQGPHNKRLREQIDALDVAGQLKLMGFTTEYEHRLAEASIYAMSSRFEGLPMVLLEAMSKGVPPVSFDCPEGPRQLITDGVNGLLIENGSIPALTAGLRKLVEDEELRRRLGAGAFESARAYQVDHVTDQWEQLFGTLVARREAGADRRPA